MSIFAAALTYPQAILVGIIQGATELFPISSLGHAVIVPALFGWDEIIRDESASDTVYLPFVVAAHLATSVVLFFFFRHEWKRIVRGLIETARTRRIDTADERMAWLLVVGTIPTAVIALLFQPTFREVFSTPEFAAFFLALNGVILLAGERLRQRAPKPVPAAAGEPSSAENNSPVRRLDSLRLVDGVIIGTAQIGALFTGISRSGVTMVGGLLRGLSHEEAARFSFLLATPVIFGAGVYKLPALFGPAGEGVRGQILVGSLVSGFFVYLTAKGLLRYFETNRLTPFGIYCLVMGLGSLIYFVVR